MWILKVVGLTIDEVDKAKQGSPFLYLHTSRKYRKKFIKRLYKF